MTIVHVRAGHIQHAPQRRARIAAMREMAARRRAVIQWHHWSGLMLILAGIALGNSPLFGTVAPQEGLMLISAGIAQQWAVPALLRRLWWAADQKHP